MRIAFNTRSKPNDASDQEYHERRGKAIREGCAEHFL